MIYLMRSYTKDGSILKIGYTDNIDNRLSQYRHHNPGVSLLDYIENADRNDERELHDRFREYRKFGNEWYSDNDVIVQYFNSIKTNTKLKLSKYHIRSLQPSTLLNLDKVIQEIGEMVKESIPDIDVDSSKYKSAMIHNSYWKYPFDDEMIWYLATCNSIKDVKEFISMYFPNFIEYLKEDIG